MGHTNQPPNTSGSSDQVFGDMLRELRLSARLTQAGLAERAHLSVGSINDLERGVHTAPRRETVRLLADALGLVRGRGTHSIPRCGPWSTLSSLASPDQPPAPVIGEHGNQREVGNPRGVGSSGLIRRSSSNNGDERRTDHQGGWTAVRLGSPGGEPVHYPSNRP
jgi:DNA-binding XRE family transcriptional regulator